MVMPGGEWRTAKLMLSKTVGPDGKEVVNAISYGTFFGSVVDFLIIALVVYMMTKALIKEPAAAPPPRLPRTARAARKPSPWTPPSASSVPPISISGIAIPGGKARRSLPTACRRASP